MSDEEKLEHIKMFVPSIVVTTLERQMVFDLPDCLLTITNGKDLIYTFDYEAKEKALNELPITTN
jgi:hypothetical protein